MVDEYIKNYPPALAVAAAVFISPVIPIAHIIFMRFFKKRQKAVLFMLFSFMIYLALLLFVWAREAGKFVSLPFFTGGFSTAVFFCLGYAEFFFMMIRGFSMRMVADICSRGSMGLPRIIAGYGGRGMGWMLDKRIRGIKVLGMVEADGRELKLKSPAGVFAARIGLLTKKVLKLGKGG